MYVKTQEQLEHLVLPTNDHFLMEEYIKNQRPSLKQSSIRTYCSSLRFLFKRINYSGLLENFDTETFLPYILPIVHSLPCKRQINIISALIVSNKGHSELVALLKHCNEKDRIQENKQELTDSQKMAYLDWNSIIATRNELANRVAPYWIKLTLSDEQFNELQDYVIVCLYTYCAPRRSLDYIYMRPHEPCSEYENGIFTGEENSEISEPTFIFQKYKTMATYGSQKITIPLPLWSVLREWLKVNPHEWLLTQNGKQMNSVQLTRRLQKIFGRPGFGVNMLRHAYVSEEVLGQSPFLDELKEIAYKLGHSMNETLLYKKHI